MTIPDLVDGLLPEGIHPATIPEIQLAFGSANPRRVALMGKLEKLFAFAGRLELFRYVFVDGSFCTDKDLPGDVDVVIETLERATLRTALVDVDARRLFDRAHAKATWEADVFVQPPGPGKLDMVGFFTNVKEEEILRRGVGLGRKRGILRVAL